MNSFDKLFKINIAHNITEGTDFENICKTLLMRMYRRKFANVKIYSEYNPLFPNETYPDIFVELKDTPLIIELQSEISTAWKSQIMKKYPKEKYDLIIVPLKKVETDWKGYNIMYKNEPVNNLRRALEVYVV